MNDRKDALTDLLAKVKAGCHVVSKAQVSATMDVINTGTASPIFKQQSAWRKRCVEAERDMVEAVAIIEALIAEDD